MRNLVPLVACALLVASSALVADEGSVLVAAHAHWIEGGDETARRTSGLARWGGSSHLLAVRDGGPPNPTLLVNGEDGGACCTPSRFMGAIGLDFEGIAFVGGDERRFLAVSEGAKWQLFNGQLPDGGPGQVIASWELPCVEKSGCNSNRGFEGIAYEPTDGDGLVVYLAYEGQHDGPPGLFQLTLPRGWADTKGFGMSPQDWQELCRRPARDRNAFSGLELTRISDRRLLLVLQRDDPSLLVFDLDQEPLDCAHPACSLRLELRSPREQTIDWPSPEGIAYNADKGDLYLVADPARDESGVLRWRLRGDDRYEEASQFEREVPLLWKIESLPAKLTDNGCLAPLPEDKENS